MAGNYSIVVDSKFNPFSYEELLKTALMATQEQKDLQKQYSDELQKAGNWAALITNPEDKEYKDQLNAYMDDIKANAQDLLANGLNPSSQADFYDINSRYSTEVTPIETAYKRRQELANEQRVARVNNPDMRFSTDYSTSPLKALIENPNADYEALNGAQITESVRQQLAPLANTILQDPEWTENTKDNTYWNIMVNSGYTPERIMAELATYDKSDEEIAAMPAKMQEHYKELKKHVPSLISQLRNNMLEQYSGNKAFDKDWVNSYINKGITAGIGKSDYNTTRNNQVLTKPEEMNFALQQAELALKRQAQELDLLKEMNKANDNGGSGTQNSEYYYSTPATVISVDSNGANYKVTENPQGENSAPFEYEGGEIKFVEDTGGKGYTITNSKDEPLVHFKYNSKGEISDAKFYDSDKKTTTSKFFNSGLGDDNDILDNDTDRNDFLKNQLPVILKHATNILNAGDKLDRYSINLMLHDGVASGNTMNFSIRPKPITQLKGKQQEVKIDPNLAENELGGN